ncbi:hypothetical protein QJQ45_002526 [Haematococcus lacustris]|nr:hypothetical protein QJQ45_002526 [Haematococcus lacustris]
MRLAGTLRALGNRPQTANRLVRMSAVLAAPYLPTAPKDGPSHAEAYPHGLRSLSEQPTTIYSALKRLGPTFEETPMPSPSMFIKPASVFYEFDGRRKRWDVVENHPSVGAVLYHKGLQCFLIVRQFRPAVYATELRAAPLNSLPAPSRVVGFTYELCAGLVDKAKSVKQLDGDPDLDKDFKDFAASRPALYAAQANGCVEGLGFEVPLERIHDLGSSVSSAGTSGARHAMFYAEVDDSMRASAGGGLQDHNECIEVLALPLDSTPAFVLDGALPKSPGLMFGLLWGYHTVKQRGGLAEAPTANWNPNLTQELTLQPVLPA